MIYDKKSLKIYQIEILEETKYAWGEMRVGSFEFTNCSHSISLRRDLSPEERH